MSYAVNRMALSSKDAQSPYLPADAVVVPCFASQLIHRSAERPCQPYLDITFLESKKGTNREPDALVFQNYYTSSISMYMHVTSLSSTTYLPLLIDRKIMPNPYGETASQDWVMIPLTEFGSKYIPGKPIRITLAQPNTAQKTYEIRNCHAVANVPGQSSPGVRLEDSSESDNSIKSEKDLKLWKMTSLSSIIKAEAHFLEAKALEFRVSVQKENERIDKLIKSRNELDKGTSKSKKKKSTTDKKKLNSLSSGASVRMDGTKKVSNVDDDEPNPSI